MALTPTPEQTHALELFQTGKSLAIEAGAGAGKTSTLRLLAESTPRRGQYVAFNRAIVEEAKAKMPRTVNASTAHSLAYRNVIGRNRTLAERLRSGRMTSTEIANRLKVDAIRVNVQDGTSKNLARTYLAGVAMRGVTRFCQSADAEIGAQHVPYIKGIDLPPGARGNNDMVARALVPAMRRAWADLTSDRGELPFRHDHYLKMWHLSGPRIDADYILFDEAQDANPVLVDIVRQQTHAQLVWVGDSQQSIYSFTGAINALETVGADQQAILSKSFRFGPEIAAVANRCLDRLNADLRLTGTESIPSRVEAIERPSVVLCRTNAAAVRRLLDELADSPDAGPHLVGGGAEVIQFVKGADRLREEGWTEHPELACFASWAEVLTYVEQDEQGGDLRLLVNLIEEFGTAAILDGLENMPAEKDAGIVISTAHKAKGREWDTVQLADDFPATAEGEELRLLYVAVTRARLGLDITAIKHLAYSTADLAALEEAEPAAAEPITPAARAAVEALLDAPAPARVPVGQLGREFSREEIKALSDYVAMSDHETYNVVRLADGNLYVEKPGGSVYRLSPLA